MQIVWTSCLICGQLKLGYMNISHNVGAIKSQKVADFWSTMDVNSE